MINASYDKILFLDIETTPDKADFNELNPELQQLWTDKLSMLNMRTPDRYCYDCPAEGYAQEAGIYAEFGRIVCISVGYCYRDKETGDRCIRTKSFCGEDESMIITDFMDLVARFFTTPNHSFCGHNIKEFDIPYICRRALINGVRLPDCLQIAGKKPWELNFIDTMELWKFGDYKTFTSLKTLTAVFGIPTPKDDIDGSEVARVYHKEHDIKRIATYCEKDVVATIQVFLRLKGEACVSPDKIHSTY